MTAAAALALLFSCEQEPKAVFFSTELGAPVKEFKVGHEPGEQRIEVYSNGEYTITELNGAGSWISFPQSSKLDEGFTVMFDANESYPRSAMLCLNLKNQKDTVYIRQEGMENTYLSLSEPSIVPKGSQTTQFSIEILSNVEPERINTFILYDDVDNTGWIKDLKITSDKKMELSVDANAADTPRKAQIELSFVDGWNNKVTASCYVNQMNSKDEAGVAKSFEEVRAMGKTDPGFKVTENIVLSGIVVSNKASLNTVENPRNTITFIDYDNCERCIILQSEDGRYGFKVDMSKSEYNIFKRYDRISLNLNGATIVKYENPEYYDILGLTTSAIVSHQSGDASLVPEKKMHMKDLQDTDIYTYVTLLDCELPVRKGSMSPINEGYSIAGNSNRSTKAAIILRDINGDDMYLMTNTTCPYRRLGKKLPYGAGFMKGIITHELHTSFNYMDNDSGNEDTYGWIGRYQIRHTCLEDFGMADDFNDGFSALLTEYRFIKGEYQAKLYPTYGQNGYMTHSYKYTASSSHGAGNTSIINAEDFSYLGPIGTGTSYPFGKNVGNVNGLGIIMDNNAEYEDGFNWGMATQGTAYEGINNSEAGKGKTPNACGAGWSVWYNWNSGKDRPYSYIFEFSTKGIQTTQLSLQVCMLNVLRNSVSFGSRYWQIQWSTTGRDDYDNEWQTILEEFMVPDTVNWTPATFFWQSPAYKPVNVRLPLDMLNRPEVYIRIRPTRNLVGTPTAFAVAPPSNNASAPSTAMNYFAIRYNK